MTTLRFLLDQNADARLLVFLRELGHQATRIGSDYPSGLDDRDILTIADREGRIVLTDDRDFCDLVVRHRLPHAGVVLLRLGDAADLDLRIARLNHVLTHHREHLNRLVVVGRHRVRIYPPVETES